MPHKLLVAWNGAQQLLPSSSADTRPRTSGRSMAKQTTTRVNPHANADENVFEKRLLTHVAVAFRVPLYHHRYHSPVELTRS